MAIKGSVIATEMASSPRIFQGLEIGASWNAEYSRSRILGNTYGFHTILIFSPVQPSL